VPLCLCRQTYPGHSSCGPTHNRASRTSPRIPIGHAPCVGTPLSFNVKARNNRFVGHGRTTWRFLRNARGCLLGAAVMAAGSCAADYPLGPTDTGPVAFEIYHNSPIGYSSVGSSFSMSAFVLRADGAYENVTAKTNWSVSDPAVLRATNGFFSSIAVGPVEITATYQGFSRTAPMHVIQPGRQTFPSLTIAPFFVLPSPGQSAQAVARLNQSAAAFEIVTDAATWTSSDPAVVTVDRGVIKAVQPGTTHITVTYAGYSAFLKMSIHPPR